MISFQKTLLTGLCLIIAFMVVMHICNAILAWRRGIGYSVRTFWADASLVIGLIMILLYEMHSQLGYFPGTAIGLLLGCWPLAIIVFVKYSKYGIFKPGKNGE